jgi:hypothetical protein
MAIVFADTQYEAGFWADVTVNGTTITVVSVYAASTRVDGAVNALGDSVTIGDTFTGIATAFDDPGIIVFDVSGFLIAFSNTPLTPSQQITFTNNTFDSNYLVPCFLAGTRILTRRGEVAVEDLVVGDEAVTLVGGRFAPITWIGKRELDTARASKPADVWPLRVRAGAFGKGMPVRDLYLSPDHSLHVNGMLIPVRYLENGVTVARAPLRHVSYYHVELERHSVLVADGMSAESYLDTGNRGDFEGTDHDPAQAGVEETAARLIWAEQACAPLHVRGPVVAEVRRMLDARIAEMGLQGPFDPELRLVVDGQEIRPQPIGDAWQFNLPEQVGGARLVSLAHVPMVTADLSDDRRCLGVPVVRMLIDGRPVALDAPFLHGGWHAPEDGLRWTTGMAALPPLRTLTVLLAPITPQGTMKNRKTAANAA